MTNTSATTDTSHSSGDGTSSQSNDTNGDLDLGTLGLVIVLGVPLLYIGNDMSLNSIISKGGNIIIE